MMYRLDELSKLASELGLEWRRVGDDRLDVIVAPDAALTFCNLVDENDTLVGFDGTPWHSHGVVQFTRIHDLFRAARINMGSSGPGRVRRRTLRSGSMLLVDGEALAAEPRTGGGRANSAEVAGFSVFAGEALRDRERIEKLCRYIARPPGANEQLTETNDGRIAVKLKRPRRNRQTYAFMSPLGLLRRLTRLIPPAGMHLLRYAGILAPAAKLRSKVVPVPEVQFEMSPNTETKAGGAKLVVNLFLASDGTLSVTSREESREGETFEFMTKGHAGRGKDDRPPPPMFAMAEHLPPERAGR